MKSASTTPPPATNHAMSLPNIAAILLKSLRRLATWKDHAMLPFSLQCDQKGLSGLAKRSVDWRKKCGNSSADGKTVRTHGPKHASHTVGDVIVVSQRQFPANWNSIGQWAVAIIVSLDAFIFCFFSPAPLIGPAQKRQRMNAIRAPAWKISLVV